MSTLKDRWEERHGAVQQTSGGSAALSSSAGGLRERIEQRRQQEAAKRQTAFEAAQKAIRDQSREAQRRTSAAARIANERRSALFEGATGRTKPSAQDIKAAEFYNKYASEYGTLTPEQQAAEAKRLYGAQEVKYDRGNVADAMMQITGHDKEGYDATGDGKVNAQDVVSMMRNASGENAARYRWLLSFGDENAMKGERERYAYDLYLDDEKKKYEENVRRRDEIEESAKAEKSKKDSAVAEQTYDPTGGSIANELMKIFGLADDEETPAYDQAVIDEYDDLTKAIDNYERTYKVENGIRDIKRRPDFEANAVQGSVEKGDYIKSPEDLYNDYINSDDYRTSAALDDSLVIRDDPKKTYKYDTWLELTDDEKKVFYYLYRTEGEKAAYDYLNNMETVASKRLLQDSADYIAGASVPEKIAANVGSVFMNVAGAPYTFAEDVVEGMVGAYNPYSNNMANQAQAIREGTSRDWGKVGKFIYGAGMSAADSALGAAMFGEGYSYLMGMGAAAQRAQELYEQGATSSQIVIGAALDGVAEALFEHVSLEKLLSQKTINSFWSWVKETVKQGGVEASEEAATDLANLVNDIAVRGADSEAVRKYKQYLENNGGDELSALFDTINDEAGGILQDAAAGFLSGTMMGGVFNIANVDHISAAENRVSNTADAISFVKGMEAERSRAALDGTLTAEAEAAIAAAEQRVKEKYNLQNYDVQATEEGRILESEAFKSELTDRVSKARESAADREFLTTESGVTEYVNDKGDVEEGTVVSRVVERDGKKAYELGSGEVVSTDRVTFGTKAEAAVYGILNNSAVDAQSETQIAKNIISELGESADVIKAMDATRDAANAFVYGRQGQTYAAALDRSNSNTVSTELLHSAYDLGRAQYSAGIESEQAAVDRGETTYTSKGKGELVYEDSVTQEDLEYLAKGGENSIGMTDVNALSSLADALGISIHLYASRIGANGKRSATVRGKKTSANGFYEHATGDIYIDVYSGRTGNSLIMYTAAHELTHFIRQNSPAQYKALADFLVETYGAKGQSVDDLIDDQIEKANADGRTIDRDEALEEVVADSMESMLADGKVIEQLAAQKPNVVQRLIARIKEWISALKARYAKLDPDSAEGKMVKGWTDEFTKLQEMYTEALRSAREGYAKAGVGEATFVDATTGEDVAFSIREKDPPKNTITAYKVFFVKDGKLYPPMVANPGGADTPVGVWLDADVGTQAPDSKTGRKQVRAGGKGTQGGGGSLAFRPGWHLGEIPLATQFDRTNPVTGKKELFPEQFVWAECEIAADKNYQDEAMSYGYTKNGKFQHSLAGLPRVPVDGYYQYRTNPNPETVPWLITGAMKVNRLLSDVEVNAILRENGLPEKHRVGGDKTLAELGLDDVKHFSESQEGKQSFSSRVQKSVDELRDEARIASDEWVALRDQKSEIEFSDEYKEWVDRIVAEPSEENLAAYKKWEDSKGISDLWAREKEARVRYLEAQKAYSEAVEKAEQESDKKAQEASGLSEPDWHRKKAVDEFGYTPYFYDAGYVTPNGRMLNFSGEKGKHYGTRGQDHRAIGVIYAGGSESGSAAMLRFMGEGNIRIMDETPGIDISFAIAPTKEQYATIERFINSAKKRGYFTVDFTDENGNVVGNLEYDGSFGAVRVLNDIRHFYATGEVREQSDVARFHYSSREQTQAERDSAQTAKDLRQRFGLRMSGGDIAVQLGELYEQIEREMTKETPDMDALDAAVRKVVSVIDEVRGGKAQRDMFAQAALDEVRGTKIFLDEKQVAEVKHAYGSLREFTQKFFGDRVTFTSDKSAGVSLDSVWQEWATQFPAYFDAKTSSNDMPSALLDALDSMKNTTDESAAVDYTSLDAELESAIWEGYNAFTAKRTSNRAILSNALESAAQTPEETRNIQRYKESIAEIEEAEARVKEINAEIKELSFAKGARDTARLAELQKEKTALERKITKADGRLLLLEASKPLKDLVRWTRENTRKAVTAEYIAREAQLRAERDAEIERVRLEERWKGAEKNHELRRQRDEAIEAVKEKYRERLAEMRSNRNAAEMRRKIGNVESRLRQRLLRPSENRYVTKEFLKPVAEMLDMLSTYTGKSENIAAKVKALKEAYANAENRALLDAETFAAKGVDENGDPIDVDPVQEAIDELSDIFGGGDKSLRDLTVDELNTVYQTARMIEHLVSNATKTISTAKAQSINKLKTRAVREIRKGRGVFRYNLMTLRPKTVFEIFGNFTKDGAWSEMYEMLNDAQLHSGDILMDLNEVFAPLMPGKGGGETVKQSTFDDFINPDKAVDIGLKDSKGNTYTVTHDMLVMLALTLDHPANYDYVVRNGFKAPNKDRYYKGNTGEAYAKGSERILPPNAKENNLLYKERNELRGELRETEDEARRQEIRDRIEEIDAQLDESLEAARKWANDLREKIGEAMNDYDRRWYDAWRTFADKSQGYLNEATQKMYGFDRATVENYFPIRTDSRFGAASYESLVHDFTLEGAGFMKERTGTGLKPLFLEGVSYVAQDHIKKVAQYAGMAPALRDFAKITGKTVILENGEAVSLRDELESVYDKKAGKWLENLIADLNGARKRDSWRLFGKLRSSYAGAVLTLNPSVTFAQVASAPTAAAVLGGKAVAKAYGVQLLPGMSKANEELIAKYTSILYNRNFGTSERGASETVGRQSKLEVMERNAKFIFGWINAADNYTVSRLWLAAEYYVQDHFSDLQKGTDEYYEAVADMFERAIQETQPSYTTLQRPDVLRNPNELVRSLTMFMTQRLQNYSILYESSQRYRRYRQDFKNGENGVTAEDVRNAGAELRNSAVSLLVASAMIVVFKALAAFVLYRLDPWRDEDEELTAESISLHILDMFVDTSVSNFLGGSEIYSIAKRIAWGKDQQYYGVEVNGVERLNDTVDGIIKMSDTVFQPIREGEDVDWKKVGMQFKKSGKTLLETATGLPVTNAGRIADAAWNWAMDFKDGTALKFEQQVSRGKTVQARRIFKAFLDGDTEKVKKVEEELGSEKDAHSAVTSYLNEEYKTDDIDREQVTKVLRDYLGKSDDEIYWWFNEHDAKKEGEDYHKFDDFYTAVQTGKDLKKVIKTYTDNGVETKTLVQQITSYFKPVYVAASKAERSKLKGYLLNAYVALGKDRAKKSKDIEEWLDD